MMVAVAAALLASCADNQKSETAEQNTVSSSDNTEIRTVECVASGDVVYIDVDYMLQNSKLYLKEGKPLEKRVADFQQKMQSTQSGWAQKEESFGTENANLENEFLELQQNYQKGLITTINAQTKEAELRKKAESMQERVLAYQSSAQSEAQALAQEEQQLGEEQMVIMNRFQTLTREAIDNLNKDKRYKMILNAVSVIDADPSLNISDLVLAEIDRLYENGALGK